MLTACKFLKTSQNYTIVTPLPLIRVIKSRPGSGAPREAPAQRDEPLSRMRKDRTMFRSLVLGLAALALVVGGIVAEEYKGKLTKLDTSSKKLTVETKDGEKTFSFSDLKIERKGKDGNEAVDLEKASKMVEKAGAAGKSPYVTVVTKKEGDKEVATEIKMGGGKKKEKN